MTTTTASPHSRSSMLRSVGVSLIINGLLPYLIYTFMLSRVGSFNALLLSSIPPLISSVVGVVWQRRVDALGAVILTGIVLSVIAALLGGDDRVLLLRDSFVTGFFGIIYLGSLLFPRPIFYYIARQFATGNDPAKLIWWNNLWQFAGFRHGMRMITIVWGIGQLIEAAARVGLVLILPIPRFLIVSPLLQNAFFVGMMIWTFWYSKQLRQRGEERGAQLAAE